MPGHYKDKKKKRKATPFDGLAKQGMRDSFRKLSGPKPPKPTPPKPKPPKPTPPKPSRPKPPAPKNPNRTKAKMTLPHPLKRKRKK